MNKTLILYLLLCCNWLSVKSQHSTADDVKKQIRQQIATGREYADKGENVKALHQYQLALARAEDEGEDNLKAHVYKNIGALYISWKKFDDALSYYEKAQKMALELNDDELVADCHNNKGTVYEQQQKYGKALEVYKKALDLYTQKHLPAKIAMALSNIAIVYKYLKDYPASIEYNLKAIKISEKTNDKWMVSATYNNIGNLYGEMGDYPKAIAYCRRSIAIAEKINAIEIIESAYDSMAEAAAKAGDYKSAFGYHKLFSSSKDQFINIESTRQLSELSIKYETERKQKIIQQQQFEIAKRNYWIFGTLAILVLGGFIGYLIFRNNKYQQEQRLQAALYSQQEMANRALFEGEQKERIRIARDLHDSIGQMLSVIKMNLSGIRHSNIENKIGDHTLKLVDDTISEVRNISHNLIPEELHFGLPAALEECCEKISKASGISIVLETKEQSSNLPPIDKAIELSIYRIVQEILNNMVKHADATKITISIRKTAQQYTLCITDNGKGFDPDIVHTSGGLGWKNIAARINLLQGTLKVSSVIEKGSQTEITIPIS